MTGPAPSAVSKADRAILGRDPLFWLALAAIGLITPALAVLPGVALAPHWPGLAAFTLVAVGYPLLEEIAFRTGLQTWLLRRWPPRSRGITRANAATAAVFAIVHLWAHPPMWALATASPALLFGYFYERHASLASPVVLHGACNAAYFLLLV